MSYPFHGKHFVAGQLVAGSEQFEAEPLNGEAAHFSVGRESDVQTAVESAEDAFSALAMLERKERASFLRTIGDEIELRAADIAAVGSQETGLPEARLQGERARTVGQLKLFADHIEKGDYLDRRQQVALPERAPIPGPEHRLIQRPVGPVAVFGASNFPLAFSVAGGDTAAALAAGCPVVVKGHSAHPGTSEIVAEAISAAVKTHQLPGGVFSLIQGGNRDVGAALVTHPLIKAVGFTGSHAGGRALFDLCAARPEPIPFYGELGSVNPMFVLPGALESGAKALGAAWAGSLALGAGQFCTNPGVVFCVEEGISEFILGAKEALVCQAPQTMLTTGIATAYQNGSQLAQNIPGVEMLLSGGVTDRAATPVLCKTDITNFLSQGTLHEEVFGPFGLVVSIANTDQLIDVSRQLNGQLTCTIHMNESDHKLAKKLVPILERKAGRLLFNGFPTGVEVSDAMVHGGPYPASTNFGATSVGTLSIRRFLRPVCYQNAPCDLMFDW